MYNFRLEEYMNFLYKMNKNWFINLKFIKLKKKKGCVDVIVSWKNNINL